MIILSQTYEVITNESAEYGEATEAGFDWENVPYTFRVTVELIRDSGFIHPSNSVTVCHSSGFFYVHGIDRVY